MGEWLAPIVPLPTFSASKVNRSAPKSNAKAVPSKVKEALVKRGIEVSSG